LIIFTQFLLLCNCKTYQSVNDHGSLCGGWQANEPGCIQDIVV